MVGAAAPQDPATGDLEILAGLPGRGAGAQKGGCRFEVTRTYRVFICRVVHSVTLQFCNPFPFISQIPSLTCH